MNWLIDFYKCCLYFPGTIGGAEIYGCLD